MHAVIRHLSEDWLPGEHNADTKLVDEADWDKDEEDDLLAVTREQMEEELEEERLLQSGSEEQTREIQVERQRQVDAVAAERATWEAKRAKHPNGSRRSARLARRKLNGQ